MKTIGKLAAIAALALATSSGMATTSIAYSPAPAQSPPWYAWTGYYWAGNLMGERFYYCDGRERERGSFDLYDEIVQEQYYQCP